MTRPAPLAVAVLLTCLVVAGCSPAEKRATPTSTATSGDATLLGALGLGSPQQRADFYKDSQVRIEDAVARCMRTAGFDYVPSTVSLPPADNAASDPTDEATAASSGFGLTTSVDLSRGSGPGASVPPPGPNATIVAGLGEARRQAYDLALEGAPVDAGDGAKGCRARAQTEVNGVVERALSDLGDGVRDMGARIEADARMVTLVSRWSTCMSSAGYRFATWEDMYTDVHQRATPFLMAGKPKPGQVLAGATAAPAVSAGAGPTAQQLASAQVYERGVAVAHVRCMAPLRSAVATLYGGYVEQLSHTNQAAVDSLRHTLLGKGQ